MTTVKRIGAMALALSVVFAGIRQGSADGILLFKDINPGNASSNPSQFVLVGNTIYFIADDGAHGAELWKSDGTASGTVLVRDLSPGVIGSDPWLLTNANGRLFFRAIEPTNGQELWTSDGTASGTVLVKDINLGPNSSDPDFLTDVNGTLFFVANDGTSGTELWKSDGTVTGTLLVRDIVSSGTAVFAELTNVDGTLFFALNGELWKSDGTETGTVAVRAPYPADPTGLVSINGLLYFQGRDDNGEELWKSNGTMAGTVVVEDIVVGTGSSSPDALTNVNGRLFFSADYGTLGRELWKSDGTVTGTQAVRDINPGVASSLSTVFLARPQFTNVNGIVFFVADDGTNGRELWKSDGTGAGTRMVRDLTPGTASSALEGLRNMSGMLFFRFNDGVRGRELWRSDGTAAGTVLVKDINPGSGSSNATCALFTSGSLFFTATDGVRGVELWVAQVPLPPSMVAEPAWTSGTQNRVYWTAVASATTYTVQCDNAADFLTPVGSVNVSSPTVSYNFTPLADGQTYWYRVRAMNTLGLASDWAAPTSSTQDAAAPDTAATGPTGEISQANPVVPVTFTTTETGSGMRGVRLFYRRNYADPFRQYGASFTSSPISLNTLTLGNGIYELYTVGVDNAGNIEAPPTTADILFALNVRTGVRYWRAY